MTEDEILKKLAAIDHKISFLADAYKLMHNSVMQGIQVKFDKDLLQPGLSLLNRRIEEFEQIVRYLHEMMKRDSFLGTLAFMGKRLNEIEATLRDIKEEGVKKKFHLDLTMNGQELVKKKPRGDTSQTTPEEHLANMLMTLDERQRTILIHRYGILGQGCKTYKEIAKMFKVTQERIRQIEMKSLRILRNPKSKKLVMKITHLGLKRAILGIEADKEEQEKDKEDFEE